jgi:hypothetical protein
MNFQILCTKQVKGCNVSLANNGKVYFGRDLFDQLPENLQGVPFTATNIRTFEWVCRILAA